LAGAVAGGSVGLGAVVGGGAGGQHESSHEQNAKQGEKLVRHFSSPFSKSFGTFRQPNEIRIGVKFVAAGTPFSRRMPHSKGRAGLASLVL
jgi:hypothetical protein